MMAPPDAFLTAHSPTPYHRYAIASLHRTGTRAIIASMPEVVARGRKPDVSACGFCHRTNGAGGPENANIAGLPADYIIQQLADFRSGARKSAVQRRAPTEFKARLAQHATDAEIAAAAAYFAAIPTQSLVKIVETDLVPKTFVTGWHLAAVTTGEKEPIGLRIIEVPEDLEHL